MIAAPTNASAAAQHRTARRHPSVSPLLRWWLHDAEPPKPGRALVFGAGHLAEAHHLAEKGSAVDALETEESLRRREEVYSAFTELPGCRVLTRPSDGRAKYHLIVVTHVLEFIQSPRERRRLLQDMGSRLTRGADLLLSLRGWSDVRAASHQTPEGDGIVTGLGTWTRGYDRAEAEALVQSAGLVVSRGPQSAKSKHPEQVRLVCQRAD